MTLVSGIELHTTMVDCNGDEQQSSRAGNYEREFNWWPSLRAIFGMMIPCCGCQSANSITRPLFLISSTVTGTIFGQRKGRVHFCVQEDPASPPFLLLELATPTHVLVKEMQSGLLRITLECEKNKAIEEEELPPLLSEPVWSMYCNGRKVGFAVKKVQKSEGDSAIANLMGLMQSVSTGAGVIPAEEGKEDDELIYMRATYERVVGSADSEALHMINPDGTPGQELSIFLTRS